MDLSNRDSKVFSLAMKYMLNLNYPGVTPELLEKYLRPTPNEEDVDEIPELYQRMLESAQNANMMAGVIGQPIGGIANLKSVLFEFDPREVLKHYQNATEVLNRIVKELKPSGKIRQTSRSLWPRYCRTILSSADFLAQFSEGKDFHEWVRFFDDDSRARPALPMLIEREVDGFGFALACDFLKEIGYLNFGKPDIHIKDIFEALKLTRSRKDFDVFRAIIRIADVVNETPYCVDKLFWLIGSGKFYDDPHIGKEGHIGKQKKDFISYAKQELGIKP